MQMSLVDGAATIRVRRLADGETVKIETPNATVRLRGEGEYHVEVNPDSDQTIVKTRSGAADVMGGSQSYTVRANEQGVFSGLENLTAQTGPIAAADAVRSLGERSQQPRGAVRVVALCVTRCGRLPGSGQSGRLGARA